MICCSLSSKDNSFSFVLLYIKLCRSYLFQYISFGFVWCYINWWCSYPINIHAHWNITNVFHIERYSIYISLYGISCVSYLFEYFQYACSISSTYIHLRCVSCSPFIYRYIFRNFVWSVFVASPYIIIIIIAVFFYVSDSVFDLF